MAKEVNELECECGHIAGAPATLRIHQNQCANRNKDLPETVVEKVKKAVRGKKNG